MSLINILCSMFLLLQSICLITSQLYAARPMKTDDARVTPKNHCQLETWGAFYIKNDHQLWALPACNLFWDTEITLGGMMGTANSATQFQIKKLFANADEKKYGIGLVIGTSSLFINAQHNADTNIYTYIPATLNFFDSRIVLHFNVGYALQSLKEHLYNIGIGTEIGVIMPRLYAIAELNYTRLESLSYQLGLRTWIVQDSLQIDTTFGNSFKSIRRGESFVSIGLRIIPPNIL